MKRLVVFLFFIVTGSLFIPVFGQNLPGVEALTDWIEGFSEPVTGESINYYFPRADIDSALLVRATDGNMSCEWISDIVPNDYSKESITLFWAAGITINGFGEPIQDAPFDLYANGEKICRFHSNGKREFTVSPDNGATLNYSTTSIDMHGDGFGYMWLTLPKRFVTPGKPIQLKVTGANRDLQYWYMTLMSNNALGFFQQEQLHNAVINTFIKKEADKMRIIVSTPSRFDGSVFSYSINEYNGQATLLAKGRTATASILIDGDYSTIANGTLQIKSDEFGILNLLSLMKPSSYSVVRESQIVKYTASLSKQVIWNMKTEISYNPELAEKLMMVRNVNSGGGDILFVASSHQDIAWMDEPSKCASDRDKVIITPTLDIINNDRSFSFGMEDGLMLEEYLLAHPERKEQLTKFSSHRQLDWGASYTQPYEELLSGEGLARQFVYGKKWIEKTLSGTKSTVYYNVDVPGRTLQMPQIMSQSGVPYLLMSRHEKGFYRWYAPDLSSVFAWSPGHYFESWFALHQNTDAALLHITDEILFWSQWNTNTEKQPIYPILIDGDMKGPEQFESVFSAWKNMKYYQMASGELMQLRRPKIFFSSPSMAMARMAESFENPESLMGERPNTWVYIHGPSHQKAISYARKAAVNIPAAEKMATIMSLLKGGFLTYPEEKLNTAWRAYLYPDHGWGGKNGNVTDSLFSAKYKQANDLAGEVLEQSLKELTLMISTSSLGKPFVVYNTATHPRSEEVSMPISLPGGVKSSNPGSISPDNNLQWSVTDSKGNSHDAQVVKKNENTYLLFTAFDVPGSGFKTFYAKTKGPDNNIDKSTPAKSTHNIKVAENDFYKLEFAQGGLKSLYDNNLRCEMLNTGNFLGGELIFLDSPGNGAGEFSLVQQPDFNSIIKGSSFASNWSITEDGPVRTSFSTEYTTPFCQVREVIYLYNQIKKVDISIELINWNGTHNKEVRMVVVPDMPNATIQYQVPFGICKIGSSELDEPAGERYYANPSSVRPRGVQNWISANDDKHMLMMGLDVAACDFAIPEIDPDYPSLQPILIATRRSCHAQGEWYEQKGNHYYNFSISTSQPADADLMIFGNTANEPLIGVSAPEKNIAMLPDEVAFFQLKNRQLEMSMLKKADDSEDVVVRIFDPTGKKTFAIMEPMFSFSAFSKADFLEQNRTPIPTPVATRLKLKAEMPAFGVETIILHRK